MDSEYREMLEKLLKEDSSTIISNGSTDHATTLIEKLFQMAKEDVTIFSGKLDEIVYGQAGVVDAAGSFLVTDKGTISIVVECQDEEVSDKDIMSSEGSFLYKLRKRFGDSVLSQVKLFRTKNNTETFKSHFFVADNKGFRFEPDSTKHEALASFNNIDISNKLTSMFDWLTHEKISRRISVD